MSPVYCVPWIDVHSHLFGHNDITDEILKAKIHPTKRAIDILAGIFGCTKYCNFLDLLNDHQYTRWIEYRREMIDFMGCPGLTVMLPIDFMYNGGTGGQPDRSYREQLNAAMQLCESGAAAKETLLFDYISGDECVKGYKVYSSASARFPISEVDKFKQAKKPVTAHCAYGSLRHYSLSRREAREYNHPKHWALVLKEYPELRLNLAHFCGEDEWEKYNKGNESWVNTAIQLMDKYPNVFADLSYSIMFPEVVRGVSKLMTHNKAIKDRILFGLDWYMCESERAGIRGSLQMYNSLNIWAEMYENGKRFLGIK